MKCSSKIVIAHIARTSRFTFLVPPLRKSGEHDAIYRCEQCHRGFSTFAVRPLTSTAWERYKYKDLKYRRIGVFDLDGLREGRKISGIRPPLRRRLGVITHLRVGAAVAD